MPTHQATRWFYSSRVLTQDATTLEMIIQPAAIEVCDGAITSALTDASAIADARARAAAWEDLGDLLVTPSFVNAHTHLAMACFRGLTVEDATDKNVVEDLFFAVESAMSAEDVAAFARVGAYESLLSGVGLVWEHYYGGLALAEALANTPLDAVLAPTLQDLDGPGKDDWRENLDATLALMAPEWAAKGIFPALGPHATDTVSASLWEIIRDLATAHTLPIHAHVAQSIEEVERAHARHGKSPVAWLDELGLLEDLGASFLMVHAIFMSERDLSLLNATRHALGFCPYSQLIFGFPADIARWEAAGIPWCVATDAAASNDSMNPQKELRHVAGLRTMATSSSQEYVRFMRSGALDDARLAHAHRQERYEAHAFMAKDSFLLDRLWRIPGALHPQLTAGTITPGARANLTVWDTEHPSMWPGINPLRTLAMGDTQGGIYNMMSGGEWVGEGGDYHRSITEGDAYREAQEEATRRLRALLTRL